MPIPKSRALCAHDVDKMAVDAITDRERGMSNPPGVAQSKSTIGRDMKSVSQ
jgi:hypothetical protein